MACPEVRQAGQARDRHDGHLRGRRGTSCATATRRTTSPWSAPARRYWMPMDQYIGGIEHAILHLLYALLDQGDARPAPGEGRRALHAAADAGHGAQPHLLARGATRAASSISGRTRWRTPSTRAARSSAPSSRATARAVSYEGVGTMSKSKNNGVDPQELIDRYGADTARLFVMFASPPEQTLEWNDAGVEGAPPLPAPAVELRREERRSDPWPADGARHCARPPRRCAARCTRCCAR